MPVTAKRTILLLDRVSEEPGSQMTPGIHGDDFLLVGPLRKGAYGYCWLRVREIGSILKSSGANFAAKGVQVSVSRCAPVIGIELLASKSQRKVDRVGSTVS